MANVDPGTSADKAAVTANTKEGPAKTNGSQDPATPPVAAAETGTKPAPETAAPVQRGKAPDRPKHTLRSGTPSQRAAAEAAAAKKAAAEKPKQEAKPAKEAAKPKQEAKPAAKPEAKPAAKQASKATAKPASKANDKAAALAAGKVKVAVQPAAKGKAQAPVKRATATAEKDAYGFKKGSLKSKAAAMYASKAGATLTEVKKALDSSQLNVLVELENKGCKVVKKREKGKGKRPITRYFLSGMPKK